MVGLAKAIGCGRDAITSGLKELETYGYLERNRSRDDKGRLERDGVHVVRRTAYDFARNVRMNLWRKNLCRKILRRQIKKSTNKYLNKNKY